MRETGRTLKSYSRFRHDNKLPASAHKWESPASSGLKAQGETAHRSNEPEPSLGLGGGLDSLRISNVLFKLRTRPDDYD